jgi:Protein of unknown function (DUF4236)
MGFSYRKSFKAGPFRVTASKSGVSYSAGVKGARVTKRADGRVQTTLSVPRTGARFTSTSGKGKATTRRPPARQPAPASMRLVANRRKTAGQPAVTKPVPVPGQRSSVLPFPPPAGTPPIPAKGYLATVVLFPGWIQINRTFMGRINGNRSARIPWPELVGVDFQEPTWKMNGHIHFATAADPRGLSANGSGNRMAAAARNPHAIMFTWQQRNAYKRLRDMLIANAPQPPRWFQGRP